MTTITIKENIKIKDTFSTALDLWNYLNDNIQVEVTELEWQDSILSSKEYQEYNNILLKNNI